MRARKSDLRDLVREVYEENGAQVTLDPGRGIIPGARLKVTIGSNTRTVAIRTSLDREFSLTRHTDGSLATIPKVDEVAVVVPSASDPNLVEVFCFDRQVIITAFDEAVAAQQKRYPSLSKKAPIFISLDNTTAHPENEAGFKARARWWKQVPVNVARIQTIADETMWELRERVHREFADLQGLPVEEVAVEFHILRPSSAWRKAVRIDDSIDRSKNSKFR